MSDLISRSEAIQRLIKETEESKNNLIPINTVKRLLKDVDTAYSVDKVIEELDKSSDYYECEEQGREHVQMVDLTEAIEIVKHGGVGTETETIRDKAVKWNNNSSKRVPYEFIDYVEGKREIGASDDVCEWRKHRIIDNVQMHKTSCLHEIEERLVKKYRYCPYCGKKIKVVE